jgi:glycosyltransferase involved in cell wall biosynthesis
MDNPQSFSDRGFDIAIIGNYVPRKCGIATFTTDLHQALAKHPGINECRIVAMNDKAEYEYSRDVRYQIEDCRLPEYHIAAELINALGLDIVYLQHEFGIFGGSYGSYIVNLIKELNNPLVTTLHTVLAKPTSGQLAVMQEIGNRSDRLVVMSQTAKVLLSEVYGISADKIEIIFHGIPDIPFVDPDNCKADLNWQGRKIIMTFGLLSSGKGLEYMVKALPKIVDRHPEALYVILGTTHPHVIRDSGESYRRSLEDSINELGIRDNVLLLNKFVDLPTLCAYLQAADIYVTPYLNHDQIVSGSLAYALGAGKAVISTPYLHAQELLADGRGRLVPFCDPDALASEAISLLGNETECRIMRRRAYEYCRAMVWPAIADQYVQLIHTLKEERRFRPPESFMNRRSLHVGLPQLKFDHLFRLTDDVGIIQHARYSVPNRKHGYCTDDNARALIVVLLAAEATSKEKKLSELGYKYVSFLGDAFDEKSGRFHNFMGYDRRWLDKQGSDDCHGRALWALGMAVSREDSSGRQKATLALFNEVLPAVAEFKDPRPQAYALLGLSLYLERFGGDYRAKMMAGSLCAKLLDKYYALATDSWPWLEETLTYDNARIPEALISASGLIGGDALSVGLKMIKWLMEIQTDSSGYLAPIGNAGWFKRGCRPARFDQQPIEAESLLGACLAAFKATGEEAWKREAHRCLDWFLGWNDIGQSLYDPKTGGCFDGLGPYGVNLNQGAESTLAWLLSILRMRDQETPTRETVKDIESGATTGLESLNV